MADLLGGAGTRGWGGLAVGLVTNNEDPEQVGRVKVRFPTLSDSDESTWARIAAPGAGPARGLQWLPEVGDEVLVGFELDDKTRPIVLGGLWSRKDKPPEPDGAVNGGQTTVRVLASRKNHRVVLTDDPTSAVDLSLGDTSSALHLEKDESRLAAEQKLSVTGATIEITATQKVVIDAPSVEIRAKSDLTLSGKPIRLN